MCIPPLHGVEGWVDFVCPRSVGVFKNGRIVLVYPQYSPQRLVSEGFIAIYLFVCERGVPSQFLHSTLGHELSYVHFMFHLE